MDTQELRQENDAQKAKIKSLERQVQHLEAALKMVCHDSSTSRTFLAVGCVEYIVARRPAALQSGIHV